MVLRFTGHTNKQGRRLWHTRCVTCGHEAPYDIERLKKCGCRRCRDVAPRPHRRQRPFEALYNALVQRGRHPVELTYEQFSAFTSETECHYCGAIVVWIPHRKPGDSTASNLDRKDNAGPYAAGNVVVCCLRCNIGKNVHFTYDEWREIGAVIRRRREQAAEP
jgi:hypothetical protein